MSNHTVVYDGPRSAGDTMNGIVKYAVECSCGRVSLADDAKSAQDQNAAHVPDDTYVAPPVGRR